jgi:hypothetical protein
MSDDGRAMLRELADRIDPPPPPPVFRPLTFYERRVDPRHKGVLRDLGRTARRRNMQVRERSHRG